MKVKQRSRSDSRYKTYSGISFYLADLKHIVEVAKARGATCQILDDTKEYDDLADLVAHCPPKIKNLELRFAPAAGTSHVWIKILAGKTTVSTFDNDESLPLWYDLSSYLDRKLGFLNTLIRPTELFCMSGMVIVLPFYALKVPHILYVQFVLMAVFFCLFLISVLVLTSARVHLEERHQINRQIKMALGAVALVVLGVVLVPFVEWAMKLIS